MGCLSLKMSITEAEKRTDFVRQAFWLEWLTIAWMVIEAAVALWSGYAAHSITLLAFGLDSVIELISAGESILTGRRQKLQDDFLGHGVGDFAEDRVDDVFNVALIKVRIGTSNMQH